MPSSLPDQERQDPSQESRSPSLAGRSSPGGGLGTSADDGARLSSKGLLLRLNGLGGYCFVGVEQCRRGKVVHILIRPGVRLVERLLFSVPLFQKQGKITNLLLLRRRQILNQLQDFALFLGQH
jgi:hypothetical protein